ncbi:hypothetical protein EDC44_10111 [Cricetibacter osteomyelitidis]|uniref:Adhesin n=1 Tax=Cricetibacter osteomyelitidis TaxID=1521931 RepID=A0A4R2T5E5_9PAST|nr:adhesin [Cricetibacter osteomyelitidis]TCP97630.1 hypothetical protein EDC44_10111 [Cricetibacter osteomyelitidis]
MQISIGKKQPKQNYSASLINFERAVSNQDRQVAGRELVAILQSLEVNGGSIQQIEMDIPRSLTLVAHEDERYFCTRLAVAVSDFFRMPELVFSDAGAIDLLTYQRRLAQVFASSPFLNADHVLRSFDIDLSDHQSQVAVKKGLLQKFCILYFPESNIPLNFELLWQLSPELCISLCFALQSDRFIGTTAAFRKRHILLKWLPTKLSKIKNLNGLNERILHDVYMRCSYDTAAEKHRIKEGINGIIRRHLLENGWQDRNIAPIGYIKGKPIMMVYLEHFHATHSIFRTHSTSLRAAWEQFFLIGFGGSTVDQQGKAVFDIFYPLDTIPLPNNKLKQIRHFCEQYKPAVFYMPSIGMDLTSVFLSNTRLAPIQAVALGHPATTHSPFIDYVIVEDDYVGSEQCFSESLIRLPKDALPYIPSANAPKTVEYCLREEPEMVRIGIASHIMKLNPQFLEACRQIRDKAKVKIHFHFALGASKGIVHIYVERFLKSYLGNDVTAHSHLPYQQYLDVLHQCDMLINPFPFGNTNGIIDMVTLGLVGICKTGPEVHEHIDEGLFKRLGLPDWLIASSVEEYIERAIRLAENHKERLILRRHIIENNGLQTLFTGDPSPMGKVLLEKVKALGM